MGTPVSDFYDPVRFLLGDHDDAVRLYPDAAIARGVRVLLRGGQVEGFTVSSDQQTVEPMIQDPNIYLLLAAKVARRFVGALPENQGAATRAFRENIGHFRTLCGDLDEQIYKLENGTMFSGWRSFYSWAEEVMGMSLVTSSSAASQEDIQRLEAAQSYEWRQDSAASEWLISHPLDRHPSVTVVDSAGNVVLGDVIYLSSSQIRVLFAGAFSGKAYLN